MSHPEPLTPADCNLRGFGWMPLDVQRLLDSDLFILSTGDEFKAAVALWAKAWSQVPAASLPNDDRLLAHLSGAGANWPAVRAMALRGFILCSDGRLYHNVLAEKAVEAWKEREKSRERQRKWRERAAPVEAGGGDETVTSPSRDALRDDNVTDDRTGHKRDSRVEDTSCNSEQPPGPDKSGARAERADRGSRLPSDWTPSDEDRAFAQAEGIDPEREAGSFRDYWHAQPGAKGRKSNWSATWRNWVRRSAERNANAGARNGAGTRHRNGFIVLAERLAQEDRDRAARSPVVDFLDAQVRGPERAGGNR